MHKILTINPGSTSTKFAVFEDENQILQYSIQHTSEDLKPYSSLFDQYQFRENLIIENLIKDGVALAEIAIVVGRGGLLRPLESGIYEVNDTMIKDLKAATNGEHASNLGAVLAKELAGLCKNCKAYIADPVVVDELQDVARISGLPQFPRRSTFHALNHKAMARKYALECGIAYESLNLVVAHLGGGISVAAHQLGRVIDTNQALDGFGPFSPERAGTMDAGALIRLCFEGKYELEEIQKMLVGRGGLVAHLHTNNVKIVEDQIKSGDKHAKLILEAMAYTIAKEIGSMIAVLRAKVDAVIITGGIANSSIIVNYIQQMISPLASLVIYPGEDEMLALAQAGLRILKGEKAKEY